MSRRYFALVPAAGRGERVGGQTPKQYLLFQEKPLLYYSLKTLCHHSAITQVLVVLHPADDHWRQFDWQMLGPKLQFAHCGGTTRAQTVMNGLNALASVASADDGIVVHDAARPFLSATDLDSLFAQAAADFSCGCLLAMPATDTIKQEGAAGRSAITLDRSRIWLAQTPQMFPFDLLRRALAAYPQVTDEATAVESLGYSPYLVAGDGSAFKITWARDLNLVAAHLLPVSSR